MKRTALALTLILALLVSAVVGSQFVNLTVAVQVENSSTIQIESPKNSSVIYGDTVRLRYNIGDRLDFVPREFNDVQSWGWLGYSLDGAPSVEIWSVPGYPGHVLDPPAEATSLLLFDVPDGPHEIRVMATGIYFGMVPLTFNISSSPVHFIVDTGSPNISILSPMNKTYTAIYDPYITTPLTFKTSEPLSWFGYSLDGGGNITISENGTWIEIPAESRSLTLYANDTAGNWATPQTVYYETAANLDPVPSEPFPTALIVASIMTAAVVIVGLLVYFKKRKQQH